MSRLPAAKRREQLLETASKLFASHGYARATTSQIARAAGVTEPIIYRHFSSKRELFIALIERIGDRTIQMWEKELHSAPTTAERLKRLIGSNPMVTNRGKGKYRVVVQAMTEADDPEIRAALDAHIAKLQAFLKAQVADAQEQGLVSKRFGPGVTAWSLIHIGLGFGVLSAMGVTQHKDTTGEDIQELLGQLMLGPNF